MDLTRLASAIGAADAPSAEIRDLAYDTRAVELSMDDDGRGFIYDPRTFVQGGHFGLQGMRERAAEIGGMLRVDSEPAKGTRISLRVEIP